MDEKETHQWPDNIPRPTSKEVDQAWENVISRIRDHENEKRRRKLIRYYFAASAAILILVGSLISYNTLFKPDLYLARAGNKKIHLADGSLVTLLKGATLKVEKSFPADTREVYLTGDALFEVAKSKAHPFIVHSQNYETKVLGTVFKVSQHGKAFTVDLFEGKVLVYRTGHSKESASLSPQQTFRNFGMLQAASVTRTGNIESAPIKDRSATLTFDECPIKEAIQVIENTYRIKITYPAELENSKITITLSNATAEVFIQTLALHLNLNSIQNNDSIFKLEN